VSTAETRLRKLRLLGNVEHDNTAVVEVREDQGRDELPMDVMRKKMFCRFKLVQYTIDLFTGLPSIHRPDQVTC